MNQYLKNSIALGLLLVAFPMFSQKGVGINTSEIAPGSALQIESTTGSLVMPRMTNTQMLAITDVLDGAIVFNTTDKTWYNRINGIWTKYVYNEIPSIILYKEGGKLTQTSSPLHLPLNSSNSLYISTDYYELNTQSLQNGTVKILRNGLYIVTVGMSTTNLPPGAKKYKILLYVNGNLASYLTSGYVKLNAADYWGTSGNSPVYLQAHDIVEIKYTLDGTGDLTGKYFNIGISKL